MNRDAISAVSEVIGAFVVVVSLVYLAVQVRSGTRATRATVYQGMHDSFSQFDSFLASDPVRLRVFEGFCSNDPQLSDTERALGDALVTQLFNKYELYFVLNRERMFSRDLELVMANIIAARLRMPGVEAWLQQRQARFSPDFVAWVKEISERS